MCQNDYIRNDESQTNTEKQSYEIPVWADTTLEVGDRIRYNADGKWVWGTVTSREEVDVDAYWAEGTVELVTVETEGEDEVDELYVGGGSELYYERTYDDGFVSWQVLCRWGVRRTAEVTVPTSAFGDYDLDDPLTAVSGIGEKTAQDLRFAETVGELGAWRCAKYTFGVDIAKKNALSLSMRVDYNVRSSSYVSDDEFSATLIDEGDDEDEQDDERQERRSPYSQFSRTVPDRTNDARTWLDLHNQLLQAGTDEDEH